MLSFKHNIFIESFRFWAWKIDIPKVLTVVDLDSPRELRKLAQSVEDRCRRQNIHRRVSFLDVPQTHQQGIDVINVAVCNHNRGGPGSTVGGKAMPASSATSTSGIQKKVRSNARLCPVIVQSVPGIFHEDRKYQLCSNDTAGSETIYPSCHLRLPVRSLASPWIDGCC
jgi:hypothetical protein